MLAGHSFKSYQHATITITLRINDVSIVRIYDFCIANMQQKIAH